MEKVCQLSAILHLLKPAHQSYKHALGLFILLDMGPACQVWQLKSLLTATLQRICQFYLIPDTAVLVKEIGLKVLQGAVRT